MTFGFVDRRSIQLSYGRKPRERVPRGAIVEPSVSFQGGGKGGVLRRGRERRLAAWDPDFGSELLGLQVPDQR